MNINKLITLTIVAILSVASFTTKAQKIAAGWSHSLYICNNGSTLNAWGADTAGQLGNGVIDMNPHDLPMTVNNITGVKAIRAGYQHSLALKQDSTVWTWGSNTFGQLGNGSFITSTSPVQVNGLNSVIAVSGGQAGYHSLALKADGTVWTWGKNTEGQLGDGTLNNSNIPVQVSGLSNVIAIAGGEYHSLALKNDGTVWAWGRNSNGQLGDSTTTNSSVPVQVLYLSGVTDIKGGRYFSFALKSDSTVWSWGQNADGQLGDGTTTQRLTPVQVVNLNQVVAIAGSAFHCLALKSDGTIRAWGRGVDGQLGDGLQTASSIPVQVLSINNAVEIVSGTNYSFALTANDSIYAWGRNIYGQLGNDTSGNYYYSPVPTLGLCATSLANPIMHKISAGWSHSLYVCNTNSSLNSWGANSFGQLGNNTTNSAATSTAVPVANLTGVKSVDAGYQHTLALMNDSTVYAWGSNVYGQLGIGSNIADSVPMMIAGLNHIIAISGGTAAYHSIALKDDGTVWTWGRNSEGQLGDGTNNDSNIPIQVNGLNNVIAISGGEYHSIAIKDDGTVWTWGKNTNGQLGNGSTVDSNVPVQVNGLTNVIDVAAGRYFSMALRSDNTVWCWGENLYGQLGNGSTVDASNPVQVSSLNDATAIAGGAFHGLAIKSDATVVSWGRNTYGNLGNGTTTDSSTPVAVSNLSNIVAIDGGTNYSLALNSNDSLFSFGRNVFGQLGDGTTSTQNTPVSVISLCTVVTEIEHQTINEFTEFSIFPNPSANGLFKLKFTNSKGQENLISNKQVQVFSLVGESVKFDFNSNTIDISNQPNGVYFISLMQDLHTYNFKIVKQ